LTDPSAVIRILHYINAQSPPHIPPTAAHEPIKLIYCPLDPVCPVLHAKTPKPSPHAPTAQVLTTSTHDSGLPHETLRPIDWMKCSKVYNSEYVYPDGLQFSAVSHDELLVSIQALKDDNSDPSIAAPSSADFIKACTLCLSQIDMQSIKFAALGSERERVSDSVFIQNLGWASFIGTHFFDAQVDRDESKSAQNLRWGGKLTSRVLKFPCPMSVGDVVIDPASTPASCYLYTYSSADYDNPYSFYPRSTFLSCVYARVINNITDDILSHLRSLFGSGGLGSLYEFNALSSLIMCESFTFNRHSGIRASTVKNIEFLHPSVHTYVQNINNLKLCQYSNSWYLPNSRRFPIIDAMAISKDNVLMLLQITSSDRHDISETHSDALIKQVVGIAQSLLSNKKKTSLRYIAFVIFSPASDFALKNYIDFVGTLNKKLADLKPKVRADRRVRAYAGLHVQAISSLQK
jgi:hypothetical protein